MLKNGVVVILAVILFPCTTVAESSPKAIAVVGILGSAVARIIPLANNEYPIHFC